MNKHNETETKLQIQKANQWFPELRGVEGGKKYIIEIKTTDFQLQISHRYEKQCGEYSQ